MNMTRRHWSILGVLGGAALMNLAACGDDTGVGGSGGGGAPAGGSIVITASGESLSLGGYGFPPASQDDPAFVDGWEVKFTRLLVTVDKITLSETPDLDPGDQAKTGSLVAQVDGPFAVDLHKGGPLPGKGGSDEQAVEIAVVENQNKNGGAAFAADTRYALGFDVIAAAASAKQVNLDDAGKADYQIMIDQGYTVLYVGTATWKGTGCTPADPYFDTLPKVVDFKLGFKAPATYLNCQNPDNAPAEPLGGEEHLRGVVVKANQAVTAQLTIHTDHPFWDSSIHDAAAHFDMFAARKVGATGTPLVTLEDLKGVDPTAITDSQNMPVPWRSCTETYALPSGSQMSFDTGGVPVNPGGDPSKVFRDMYDFATYNLSTQGHLNADGLCAVKRHYPSPF